MAGIQNLMKRATPKSASDWYARTDARQNPIDRTCGKLSRYYAENVDKPGQWVTDLNAPPTERALRP